MIDSVFQCGLRAGASATVAPHACRRLPITWSGSSRSAEMFFCRMTGWLVLLRSFVLCLFGQRYGQYPILITLFFPVFTTYQLAVLLEIGHDTYLRTPWTNFSHSLTGTNSGAFNLYHSRQKRLADEAGKERGSWTSLPRTSSRQVSRRT